LLISLIVAISKNRVIGAAGQLPWRLPGDLQRFKRLTMGQTLLMGRKTYQSIGRPLPGRKTIVLSRDPDFRAADCTVAADLPSGLAAADGAELFICGGGEIYRQTLPLVERIYLTELQREVAGDTFFPEIPTDQFQVISRLQGIAGDEAYCFSILQRRDWPD
jgi:dihydrofolate reductase